MAASTATANTEDDKGRGSYKCGRCGVPKKGHVCPYQPKVKRRPDEPVPEMKCVSTQVEMDEVSFIICYLFKGLLTSFKTRKVGIRLLLMAGNPDPCSRDLRLLFLGYSRGKEFIFLIYF